VIAWDGLAMQGAVQLGYDFFGSTSPQQIRAVESGVWNLW